VADFDKAHLRMQPAENLRKKRLPLRRRQNRPPRLNHAERNLVPRLDELCDGGGTGIDPRRPLRKVTAHQHGNPRHLSQHLQRGREIRCHLDAETKAVPQLDRLHISLPAQFAVRFPEGGRTAEIGRGDAEQIARMAIPPAIPRLKDHGRLPRFFVPEPRVTVGRPARGDDNVPAALNPVADRMPVLPALVVKCDPQPLPVFPSGELTGDRTVVEIHLKENPPEVGRYLQFGEVARPRTKTHRRQQIAAVQIDENRVGPRRIARAPQEQVLPAEVVVRETTIVHAARRHRCKTQEREVFLRVRVLAQKPRHFRIKIRAVFEESREQIALDQTQSLPALKIADGLGRPRAMGVQMKRETVRARSLASD